MQRTISSVFLAALFLAISGTQLLKADALVWTEFNAVGGIVATGVLPSGCPNPLPQTFACGPDPFSVTTPDGKFTLTGADTVTNTLGLFQFLNIGVTATDNTGANGSILLDVNQTYLFSGVATSYAAFEFMTGFFSGPAGAGLPDGNTSVLATLVVDGAVTLPIMSANAGQGDALGFTRGFCCALFPTPPAAGVTFDGQALFKFLSANQLAGDAIDLPFGESDAPEPGSLGLLVAGALAVAALRRNRHP